MPTLETVDDSPTENATVAAPAASPCRQQRASIADLPRWSFGSHIRAGLDCQYRNTIIHKYPRLKLVNRRLVPTPATPLIRRFGLPDRRK